MSGRSRRASMKRKTRRRETPPGMVVVKLLDVFAQLLSGQFRFDHVHGPMPADIAPPKPSGSSAEVVDDPPDLPERTE